MILVNVFFTLPAGPVPKSLIEAAVEYTLKSEQCRGAFVNCILLSDKDIRELNKRYLQHDYPTDVISFTLEQEPELEAELYIGLETARKQATEYGVPVADEIARLAVHGSLHLCGHDDDTDEKRDAMRKRENRVLEQLRNHGLLKG